MNLEYNLNLIEQLEEQIHEKDPVCRRKSIFNQINAPPTTKHSKPLMKSVHQSLNCLSFHLIRQIQLSLTSGYSYTSKLYFVGKDFHHEEVIANIEMYFEDFCKHHYSNEIHTLKDRSNMGVSLEGDCIDNTNNLYNSKSFMYLSSSN